LRDDKARASVDGLSNVENGAFHQKLNEVKRPHDLLKYK